MRIRNLELGDVANLLQFELENRQWFEQTISPRGDYFYSAAAVQDHIRAYLIAKQQSRFHACVVLDDDGQIIARANLREINLKKSIAEVGYRVGRLHAGKGIASAATAHLMVLAYTHWKLNQLSGFVSVNNPASARVLEKNGFVKIDYHSRLAVLNHGTFDCDEYRHSYPQTAK